MVLKTSSAIKTPASIGIIGGGQLARFLVEKGQNLGIPMRVLSENKNDPAAQVTNHWIKGSPSSKKDLQKFLRSISILTFESEFADVGLIKKIAPKALQIFPTLHHIKIFQDRLLQKKILKSHSISTSPFFEVSSKTDLQKCADFFNYSYVLKKRFGGYDGYGTFIVKNKIKHRQLISSELDYQGGYIAEAFVAFEFECAATFFKNKNNQLNHTPLVFSKQTQSKCDYVYGPIQHRSFEKMKKKINSLMKKINYVGALTFEFFVKDNELIVNETASRVHNSAHYTLNSLSQDQFTLHIKSILDWDIGMPINIQPKNFCMVNLIGTSNQIVKIPKNLSGNLYWYGKTENRRGRKMGHINYSSNNLDSKNLLKLALKERKRFEL